MKACRTVCNSRAVVITLAQHEQRLVPGFFFNWILGMFPRLDLLNQPSDLLLVFVLVAIQIGISSQNSRVSSKA
jgi:hypothetical protein